MKIYKVLALLSLLSCANRKLHLIESKSTINSEISIDSFTEFPPEIEGCSCSFSNTKNDFENRNYIYADDYQGNAFISINGEMKKFTMIKSQKISDEHYITTWISNDYELTLDYKQVGQIEETWQQKGIMKLKGKDGEELMKEVYGECGC